jgi:signal transduction histidine kinase
MLQRVVDGSSDEPSARVFSRIRWKLTLWYSGVLAAVLLVIGVALYVSVKHTLLDAVDSDLRTRTVTQWNASLQLSPGNPWPLRDCHPFFPGVVPPDEGKQIFACYDARGTLMGQSYFAYAYPPFGSTSIVQAALQGSSATDTINGGPGVGLIRRYAQPVFATAPDGTRSVVGVLVEGEQVAAQYSVLHTLLTLLLALGIPALLLASVGGLFLANRALLPAKLAYARQRDFIADASHELRTPLTMLRADAEVLLRDRAELSPDNAALVEDMVAETEHMSSLANSMLDLARMDTNGAHLERDVVDLSALAGDIAHRMRALASDRHVEVRTESPEPVLVLGDRLLLEQAVLVLVDNAVKYNRPSGEVVIRTLERDGQAGLEVRDTGIGIAAEHLPRLGERFYRVDKARSREQGGAGLGLSIVQTIAARHGGSLRVESEPGKGTTAVLMLPAARIAPQQASRLPAS